MTEQLKPCPFCASAASAVPFETFGKIYGYAVVCDDGCITFEMNEKTEADAAAVWNHRPAVPQ
jgi:Lar family restriction alleviation protein